MTTPMEEMRAALEAYKKGCGSGEEETLCALMEKHLGTLLDIAEGAADLGDELALDGKSYPDFDDACVKLGTVDQARLNERKRRRDQLVEKAFARSRMGSR